MSQRIRLRMPLRYVARMFSNITDTSCIQHSHCACIAQMAHNGFRCFSCKHPTCDLATGGNAGAGQPVLPCPECHGRQHTHSVLSLRSAAAQAGAASRKVRYQASGHGRSTLIVISAVSPHHLHQQTYFLGCQNYPKCRVRYSLPACKAVTVSEETCHRCR